MADASTSAAAQAPYAASVISAKIHKVFKKFMKFQRMGTRVSAGPEEKLKRLSCSGVLNSPSRESSRPPGTCVGQNDEIADADKRVRGIVGAWFCLKSLKCLKIRVVP